MATASPKRPILAASAARAGNTAVVQGADPGHADPMHTDPATQLTIAIDGYSACGKSTLARRLAQHLAYLYIDTGAMYRAVALHALRRNIDPKDLEAVAGMLPQTYLQFIAGRTAGQRDNGENVAAAIRTMQVADAVCDVAAMPPVRRYLVAQQREWGKEGGVVLDGRDIGTVVFPDADLKFFVTADMPVRVARRMAELKGRGQDLSPEAVEANLRMRDHEETTRSDSPLRQADDAVVLDTSSLDVEGVLKAALVHVEQRLEAKRNASRPGSSEA
jgi:cytidylate kinase